MDTIGQLAAELHADVSELQEIAESLAECSSDERAILKATRMICTSYNSSGLSRLDTAKQVCNSFKQPLLLATTI